MNERNATIGVDVGGTHVRIGLLTPAGELLDTRRVPRSQVLPEGDPAALGRYIADYAAQAGHGAAAVGCGIPGTLSRDCRRVLKVPNIPSLNGLPLASLLTEAAGLPVYLENDTVMLLSGDQLRLGLPHQGVVLGVYIGTGLGSALFYDGKPLKGQNGLNEIGHLPLLGKTEKCTCGNIGCAENYVSGRYLQALRAEKWPEVPISELFTAMAGSRELDEFVDTLAVVLGGAVNLLDPAALVLGGGVTAMKDFPRAAVLRALADRAMKPQPAESLRVLWSQGADDAGVLGAAAYAAAAYAAAAMAAE